jgi:hypothetical protein
MVSVIFARVTIVLARRPALRRVAVLAPVVEHTQTLDHPFESTRIAKRSRGTDQTVRKKFGLDARNPLTGMSPVPGSVGRRPSGSE